MKQAMALRAHIKSQTDVDAAAGIDVRRIAVEQRGSRTCGAEATLFLHAYEDFERALVAGVPMREREVRRRSALAAFDALLLALGYPKPSQQQPPSIPRQ
ncbi:hypothetical protein [Pararhizobium haloflavum]|uniref:hypothetical protein n=1 Tax=Pararhizobium haloflavum TaxID=2037914 RepID=UPI0012FFD557|nr:hypothetical protein [Pararhizobium haloflavum]